LDNAGNTRVLSSVPTSIEQQLADSGQSHLLHFWDELDENAQAKLVEQIASIDFVQLSKLLNVMKSCHEDVQEDSISPSPFVSTGASEVDWKKVEQEGEAFIRLGKLGVLTVAGGQGTRLGWSGPKGTFPATPVTGKSLFQMIAEQIQFASQKYQVAIPWYIMTSIENDKITKSFLLDNNCFGLQRTDIFVFPQGVVPAVDRDGKILLASRDEIFMNPDGHGGVISALKRSGGLEEMASRGIEHIAYVQVDNPLVKVVDPVFLGLHCSNHSSGEVSSKCVLKTDPIERVGVFCKRGESTSIIEYSDMTIEQTQEQTIDGKLSYCCGSIAAHLISTSFIDRVVSDLPWHVACKAIPYIDLSSSEIVSPKEPNAYKFERFIFDIIPFATNSLVVETKREEEFAPIKNATGNDSPQTSKQLQRNRAAAWLQRRGVEVPLRAMVEISPTTAASPEDIPEELLPKHINPDETVLL
jgi:UDP-N-acetylglucosamine/UDP-N-acetylgalactosamine diphosphorylase